MALTGHPGPDSRRPLHVTNPRRSSTEFCARVSTAGCPSRRLSGGVRMRALLHCERRRASALPRAGVQVRRPARLHLSGIHHCATHSSSCASAPPQRPEEYDTPVRKSCQHFDEKAGIRPGQRPTG